MTVKALMYLLEIVQEKAYCFFFIYICMGKGNWHLILVLHRKKKMDGIVCIIHSHVKLKKSDKVTGKI